MMVCRSVTGREASARAAGTLGTVSDEPADAVPSPSSMTTSWRSCSSSASAAVHAGEVLFSPADDHYDWVVILSGCVEVLGADASDHQPRRPPLPRRGEPRHPPAALPVHTVAEPGEVVVVPADVFRARVLTDPR